MRPQIPETPNGDLFRSAPEAIIDPEHELLRLAALIDWGRFDDAFGPLVIAQVVGRKLLIGALECESISGWHSDPNTA